MADIVFMIILVEGLNVNDMKAKIILNLIVIVFNYLASKHIVFRAVRN